jgi:hypothetical protein
MGAIVTLEVYQPAHPRVVGGCIPVRWQLLMIRGPIDETTLIRLNKAPTVALAYLRVKALRGLQTVPYLRAR